MKRPIAILLLIASLAVPASPWAFQRETTDDPDCKEADGVNCPHKGVPLVWDTLPVSYVVNPAGSGVAAGATIDAVTAAFGSWQSASKNGITFTFAGTSTGSSDGQDRRNTVTWKRLGASSRDTFAQSVLTFSKSTGKIFDVDIEINSSNLFAVLPEGEDDPFDPRADIQAVATHEVGHLLGLAHENRFGPQIVMFFSAASGDAGHRTLTSDDRDGVRAIYSGGSRGGGGGGGGCTIVPRSSSQPMLPVLLLVAALVLRDRARRRSR